VSDTHAMQNSEICLSVKDQNVREVVSEVK
jgi:hypothetical protein